MQNLLLAGASLLAFAAPLHAQTAPPATPVDETPIDTRVPDDSAPTVSAIPAPTGDPVLDRLNALDARMRELEARNAQLEEQAALNQARLQSVEVRSSKAVQFGWVPTIAEPTGAFTFKPRGVLDLDAVAFRSQRGGYDHNNGTGFRRARLGLEGTAFNAFNYRLEVDFAGNVVSLTDAYLQYTKIPNFLVTLGQHKAPFGLESNNSDNYNMFLERGMFTNAFGNAGAERRIGLSATWTPREAINLSAGVFGDNESVTRSTGTPLTNTPSESRGVNARATWEPIFVTGRIVHLGLAGFYRTNLKVGDVAEAVRLTDRPNVRVDNGNIADSGIITGVHSLRYAGAEAAAVLGPLTLAGEAGRLWLDRPLGDRHFTGFYGYATYALTGETRSFKGGNFDRLRPFHELGKDGLGAFEVALRYDQLDLGSTPVLARVGNDAKSLTLGLNWYFNPYAKLMFNLIHFIADNSPLDPVGAQSRGDALATRLHVDF
ncbi:MAG: OprO/OprP family phosphate-selective porin [Pseudomonadota bacterium]|nr:OprO/OprP family phosphate-selective porin [Pseudomonadota bacterium]